MKKWLFGLGLFTVVIVGTFIYLNNRRVVSEKERELAILAEEERKLAEIRLEQERLFHRTKVYADSAKDFIRERGFRDDCCILVDFSIHSGKNRLFVWNFQQDTIVDASLCCHGYGNTQNRSTQTKIVFSNVEGSLCSSLGRYQTAYRDVCSYGTLYQYRLYGLDETNSNAYKRCVTLHSYRDVPEEEIYPKHIPLGYSQGCLIVSDEMLNRLDIILKKDKKKMLIWAYI